MIIFRSDTVLFIEGGKATIIGWGDTRDKGDQSCDLLKADTKVTPAKHFICHAINSTIVQVDVPDGRCPFISDTRICVHHEDQPPAQICQGDSGGPLIMDARGYGVVIGVTSQTLNTNCPHGDWKCIYFDTAKCDKDSVAVFTLVEAYLPWIQKTTGQGYCYAVSLKFILNTFLDTQVSLAPTHVSPSVGWFVILLNFRCP